MTSTDDLVRKAQAARDALKGLYFSAEEGSPLEAATLAGAEAITGLLRRMSVTQTNTDDREVLAAHLSVEEFEDGFTWPEHADDEGYRGGGYVQIAPSDIQALRREAADRILILLQQRGFARLSSPTPDGVIKERGVGETFDTIRQWCEETFGPATPERIASRAAEEMDELLADPSKVEEAADIVIILSRHPTLWAEIERKMSVNRKRQWRLIGDGTGYHVKEVAPRPSQREG